MKIFLNNHYSTLEWIRVKFGKLVLATVPLVKEPLEVDKVHSNVFHNSFLELVLERLYLPEG